MLGRIHSHPGLHAACGLWIGHPAHLLSLDEWEPQHGLKMEQLDWGLRVNFNLFYLKELGYFSHT